jgi:cytochrome P450
MSITVPMSFEEALAAATARDPYPSYAAQVAEAPFAPAGPRRWIAAGARAVEHVLVARELGVAAARGAPAATVRDGSTAAFAARTIRRNDGELHATLRPFVDSHLAVDARKTASVAGELARSLWAATPDPAARRIDALADSLPAAVIAYLFGLDPLDTAVHRAARLLARALAPDADEEAAALGAEAATYLCARVPGSRDDERMNAAALFSQAHDATAGLIGNTLLALGADASLANRVRTDRAALDAAVAETVRHDAPVQNTRRIVLSDVNVGGHALRMGDVVLVLLAAANRDPAANDEPARFALDRPDRRSFTFGAGAHVCPGEQLAVTVASAAVACVLDASVDLPQLARRVVYRPSVNVRVPRFGAAAHSSPS